MIQRKRFLMAFAIVAWMMTAAMGQTPAATNSGYRVVSLPPPPVSARVTTDVAMPAHVSLVATPGQAAASSPPEESLIDGMNELIAPLPNAQFPSSQPSRFSPPALPALPPLPSGAAVAGALPALPNFIQTTRPNGAAPGMVPNKSLVSHTTTTLPVLAPVNQPPPQAEEFQAGELIAVVGAEHILAGDMAVFVEPIIEQNRARISSPEEEAKIRSQLTRQALRQYAEINAIYQEFFRDMLGTSAPKEMRETQKKVLTRAGKIFFEKQVPVLMEKYKVASIQELELKLTEKSLSLSTLRGQFIKQVLASELERKYVPDKFEIDRQDLINAYRDEKNKDKWNVSGRVRWRELTIRFDKHNSRQEAENRIRELGNEVFLGGKPFEAVAKQSSEGYTANEGGVYDWTTQGSLKSKEIDHALFTLPLNSLSQVIADDVGLHIVEVLEREEGHVQDFVEAQAGLRESLSEERRQKEVRAFRDRIMARTTVWTLWPEDIPGSRPLAEALGAPAN